MALPLTLERRQVLGAMLSRCDNVHTNEPTLHLIFMEEMVCGAIFVADAAAQCVEQDFWSEISDLLESGGVAAIRNLLKE